MRSRASPWPSAAPARYTGATSSGCLVVARAAFVKLDVPMAGSRAVIQGFGKVGGPLAFLLHSAGMRIVAVADVGGAVANEGGLDVGALADHAAATGSVAGFGGGETISSEAIWDIPCELLVPAALGGVIDEAVARRIRANVVVEAANGPTTVAGQLALEDRGVVVVPDILANAGGVTASYFEWAQSRQGFPWDESLFADRLRKRMDDAFTTVWARSQTLGVDLRRGAYVVALDRIADAIEARGLFP